MAQIIRGFGKTDVINVVSRRESIDKYANVIAPFFNNMGNCMVDHNPVNDSSIALFYSKVIKMPTCSNCSGGCVECNDVWNIGIADPVWEHIHLNQIAPPFMRVEADTFQHRLCDNSILITVKNSEYNRVIGEFCPHKKILLATDWTDDDSKTEFVSDIFKIMETRGLIARKGVKRVKPNITLGADPEMELMDPDTNEIINCRTAGIRDRVMISGRNEGRIGQDGAGAPRELRPAPSPTPEGLVENIDYLIKQALDETWNLQGHKHSIGGHIHFGGVQESRDFGKLLDYYLGPLGVLNGRARLESSYGKVGSSDAIRKQPHGIEFRTPPAGWLGSKELALVTLTIAKLAADKHYFGEDITLTGDVNADLVTLGLTVTQVDLFRSEIKRFEINGLPKDMKAEWGYKTPPKFILEFRDQWSDSVRDYIEILMKKIAADENLGGRCVFYGLGEERGKVFSVVMSNMNGIDMDEDYGLMPPAKTGAGKNYVGMPASIRNDIREAKNKTNMIVEVIKRTIAPPKKKKSSLKNYLEATE